MEKVKYDQLYLMTQNYLFGKRVFTAWEGIYTLIILIYIFINIYAFKHKIWVPWKEK